MALYGYIRFSQKNNGLAEQEHALRAAGCQQIYTDKTLGEERTGRRELDAVLARLDANDVLVVTRLQRLAANIKELHGIVVALKSRGAALIALEQNVDTRDGSSTTFEHMLDVFVEFDRHFRSERHLEGIAAAKLRRAFVGRKPTIDASEIIRLHAVEKLGATSIARRLGVGRTSVYRVLAGHLKPS